MSQFNGPPQPPQSPQDPGDPPGSSVPPPPPPQGVAPMYGMPAYGPPPAAPTGRGGVFMRMFMGFLTTVLLFSIGLNVYLAATLSLLMGGPHETEYLAGDTEQRIVIIPIEGLIDESMVGFVHDALALVEQDPPAAVVLRVESPGGYVGASDQVWHELQRFQEVTDVPVVASFGSVAASGGYYVAASSDYIMAEPTCTTGSIGVMGGVFTLEKLMDKIGVTPYFAVATDSPEKDVANNAFRAWGQKDLAKMQESLDYAYDRFVTVVHDGRSNHIPTVELVKKVATGAVFTTQQAIENKLVDGEGYLDDAIQQAALQAGLTGVPQVTMVQPARTLGFGGPFAASSQDHAGLSVREIRKWVAGSLTPRLSYLWVPQMQP